MMKVLREDLGPMTFKRQVKLLRRNFKDQIDMEM